MLGSCTTTSKQESRREPEREEVGENEVAIGREDAAALHQANSLIPPVVERGRGEHELEVPFWKSDFFSYTDGKAEAWIVGMSDRLFDHAFSRIDTGESLAIIAQLFGEQSQQLPRAGSNVENPPRCASTGQGSPNRARRDVEMHLPFPAALVLLRTIVEILDIALTSHGEIVSPRSAATTSA